MKFGSIDSKATGLKSVATAASLLALLVLFPLGARALENVGLVVGLDRTQLVGDEPRDFSYQKRLGLQVGAVFEFRLADDLLISLRPSYLHTKTGVGYQDPQAGVVRDSLDLTVDWISVPVLLRTMVDNDVFFVTGGFEFAAAVGGGLTDGTEVKPWEEIIQSIDLAALVGVGVEWPLGRFRFSGELRYRQGLLNAALDDSANDLAEFPPRFRFAGLQLQLGMLLPLGGRR